MEERYDAYLVIEVINQEGKVVSRASRKIRCPELLPFVKDVSYVYDLHHEGGLGRPWVQEATLERSESPCAIGAITIETEKNQSESRSQK